MRARGKQRRNSANNGVARTRSPMLFFWMTRMRSGAALGRSIAPQATRVKGRLVKRGIGRRVVVHLELPIDAKIRTSFRHSVEQAVKTASQIITRSEEHR